LNGIFEIFGEEVNADFSFPSFNFACKSLYGKAAVVNNVKSFSSLAITPPKPHKGKYVCHYSDSQSPTAKLKPKGNCKNL